jgi:hypothetical protein
LVHPAVAHAPYRDQPDGCKGVMMKTAAVPFRAGIISRPQKCAEQIVVLLTDL